MKNVGILLGTRPEAIKLLPVYLEMKKIETLRPVLISTGQHREMLKQIFDFFETRPDIDLALMSHNQTLAGLTARLCTSLQDLFAQEPLDLIVVQGDTTSAFVGGLIAFYNKIPVAHVEAGLRTYNKYSPFPEELNRKLISCVADINFAPTLKAKAALEKEHCPNIHVVGNTVVDALFYCLKLLSGQTTKYREKFSFLEADKKLVLITGHRRENFGEGFRNICDSILFLADRYPELQFVYPVHLNPNVRDVVFETLGGKDNIIMIDPLPYDEMIFLMSQTHILLTDSGGIQEEAPSLNIPTLVMRDSTERMEGIENGCALLVGTDRNSIIRNFNDVYSDQALYEKMSSVPNPYGDGTAAIQIARILTEALRTK